MSCEIKLIPAKEAKEKMDLFRSKKHPLYEELPEEQKFNIQMKKVMKNIQSSSSGGVHYVDTIVPNGFYRRIREILQELGYQVVVRKTPSPSSMDLQIIWGER